MKKIVMIGNMAWGMHKFRADLMKHFIAQGNSVYVIAPYDENAEKIRKLGASFIDIPVERKGVNPLKDFIYCLNLTKELLKIKPDIMLAYTIKPVLYGSLASWLAGVPQRIAITTGLGYTFSVNNFVSRITKILYSFCLKFSSQVWFLNKEDLETFLTNKLVSVNKTFILPGEGVDTNYYSPAKTSPETITFSLIGRMLWSKGVGQFIEAAVEIKKSHPEVKFILVGPIDKGNPESIPLETLSEWNQEGIVSYMGSVEDSYEVLSQTSCLVLPSFHEGLPRVLIEAGSMGIPCIATDIPGCRDVIKNELNGFLITPRSTPELIDAILSFILLKQEKKESASVRSRLRVENHFSLKRIFELYQARIAYD